MPNYLVVLLMVVGYDLGILTLIGREKMRDRREGRKN